MMLKLSRHTKSKYKAVILADKVYMVEMHYIINIYSRSTVMPSELLLSVKTWGKKNKTTSVFGTWGVLVWVVSSPVRAVGYELGSLLLWHAARRFY